MARLARPVEDFALRSPWKCDYWAWAVAMKEIQGSDSDFCEIDSFHLLHPAMTVFFCKAKCTNENN
ncbi:hypothetical protein RUM43_001029 [Polyplax serrata]|uniref:Uncharacterized protein n=1 Tax=Polyplax serrata TaxID=468196 RepID=A0AAN8XRE1_POLSC